MSAGRRQLFAYWRTALSDAPAACTAARQLQAALRSRHPGLDCRLFLRSDADAAQSTLMETYALDASVNADGIGLALQQDIDMSAGAALTRWQRGKRHVEVFEALDP